MTNKYSMSTVTSYTSSILSCFQVEIRELKMLEMCNELEQTSLDFTSPYAGSSGVQVLLVVKKLRALIKSRNCSTKKEPDRFPSKKIQNLQSKCSPCCLEDEFKLKYS